MVDYTEVNNTCECPLCSSPDTEEEMLCEDYTVSGESFPICRCKSCGFRFTGDLPQENDMGRYYDAPEYISHSNTRRGIVNKLYHRIRKYMLAQKYRLVCRETGRKSNADILDVGTGTGYFPATMKAAGWNVEAVEINEKARRFVLDTFGISVEESLYSERFGKARFDCITLWHVLEHLSEPGKVFERLGYLLKDDGKLIIAVPNRESADASHYGNAWAAYDVPRHLWHFAPDTLKRMAGMHGFRVRSIKPMPFDGFYVSMLSEEYKGSRFYFMKGLLVGLSAWFKSLSDKKKSSSLIFILEKNR